MNLGRLLYAFVPPVVNSVFRRLANLQRNRWRREWVYGGSTWPKQASSEAAWNDISVAQIEEKRMVEFGAVAASTAPFTVDLPFHNTYMVFGTVLGIVSQGRPSLSFLDYGGGGGRYLILARALQPNLSISYTCKEVPSLCELGSRLHANARFVSDDEACFGTKYDFVMASTSLHYAADWRALASRLAASTNRYLLVTRLPVLRDAASYVVLQRPFRHGYRTEYFCWFLNRKEFLDHMDTLGLEMIREFYLQERPQVSGAPAQCEYTAFLFRRGPETTRTQR